MEEVKVILNDFLFNAGVLGFYRILQHVEKKEYIKEKGNMFLIQRNAFNNFEEDYIKTMIDTFEEDTRWFNITRMKENIARINVEEKEEILKLNNMYSLIKKAMESASYKSGYEIIKKEDKSLNPYDCIEKIKNEKSEQIKKEQTLNIINHLEKYKEVYCMKDIIYNKINSFWEGVSFLNRNANKNNIKDEYKKVFVAPAIEYLDTIKKSELRCIECGNIINKSKANGMAWLKDVGVDFKKKQSGFWNFNEDTYICPICYLIYSCIPLGFTMIGSNAIFINSNERIRDLISNNTITEKETEAKEESFEKIYDKVLYNFINRSDEIANKKMSKYEPENIQVIKRIGLKDEQKYEIDIIAKDKIKIFKDSQKQLQRLVGNRIYTNVIKNIIQGINQYDLIYKIFQDRYDIKLVEDILKIQLNSIGGTDIMDKKKMTDDMIKEGEKLQLYFYHNSENQNKLKAYIYKLQGALKANSVEEFMKLFTLFYGSLSKMIPDCDGAIRVLMQQPEYFRLLGYAYIYGLEKRIEKKEKIEENEGGNKNEE